ncbi:beta-glucoside kinase [Paraliobacillus ryukyuensis]|uniref:Putative NBD/HSP70 family sugar kinase n=1 Tax=Paraliobacillus ryukyuensis TaxID=200904 RepID=A0A366DYM9_9BACI|nr:ROK family protein [Paraliobacillus ryukyuensis]RBO95210.1 putative NBD/HSP70 family sugar kinase [Paraliobacillus ryukyuensis]
MYLVFDIGGTFVKHAWMTADGEMLADGKFETPYDSPQDLVNKMADLFFQNSNQVKGIAVSCPGTIDVDTGVVYYGGSLRYLHNYNLAKALQEKCQVPVSIENDGKSAALAEWWLGSVKGYRNAVVVILGTGLGGGLIINDKLHRGKDLQAGEFSLLMDCVNQENNKASVAGTSGSAINMINQIAEQKQFDKNDGETAFRYINDGDKEATTIFNHYCKRIAFWILNIQYIIDPDIIAIGGGISVQPIVLKGINQAIEALKQANPFHQAKPHVVTCAFQNAANLYGALYHHLNQHN